MKGTLTFDLPEEQDQFEIAIKAPAMNSVLWEMDQWLRSNTKYAPDTMSDEEFDAYQKCRDELHRLLEIEGVRIY